MNPFIKNKKQLGIFITAGYPELNDTGRQILQLQKQDVDFIEIGIPFSDPMADGPVIQASSSKALANGMHLNILFEQINEIRSHVNIPLVFMGYFNTVLCFGLERFLIKCNEVAIYHVIFPDLSLEIYNKFYRKQFETHGVYPIFLITPKTDRNRIQQIAEVSQNGFVYLVSDNSTTGNNCHFSDDRLNEFREIKELCGNTPLFIGFGIKSKSDVRFVQEVSDGAIIGTAYLKAVQENKEVNFIESIITESTVD